MILKNINRYVSKHILVLYLAFICTGLIFFSKFKQLIQKPAEIYIVTDTVTVYTDTAKTHQMFLQAIGLAESSNDYRKVNRLGYLGKYQFSYNTLKDLKIKCTPQEFLDQPMLQEYAMEQYLKHNKKVLAKYIGTYQFTTYRGIYITESGILAAAHLGGATNVKRFFNNGKVFKDANNTPITRYLKKFSGYQLKFK